eukprot:CAMPEP_0118661870 /NCGR_PEP_ID=MMETSP0785-20121206/16519_1 /TAXON_ID=91992 /ORGANISM="Bolidomonas pacifica, Strain CCMP 1866" /LENGTH=450 /DNA_ID=CAMNT_0006555357 /DNA_START=151 /DNA_END=1500 /DNA_ORIENTATION=+
MTSSTSSNNPPNKHKTLTYVIIFASINSINLGYDVGSSSGLQVMLQSPSTKPTLDQQQMEIYLGLLNFSSLIGCLIQPSLSVKYGRRKVFLLSSLLFLTGLTLQSISQSLPPLIIGRTLVGIGVGVGLSIDPVYIAECCPKGERGEMVTWSEVSINLGITLGYLASYLLRSTPSGWRYMLSLGCIGPLLIVFSVLTDVVPESPRWLVSKGRVEDGIRVVEELMGEGKGEEVVRGIMEDLEGAACSSNGSPSSTSSNVNIGYFRLIFFNPSPVLRRMIFVGVMVSVIQQGTGIDGVQYYMHDILERAGMEREEGRFRAVLLLGILKTFSTYIAGLKLDKYGRRPMLLTSLTVMLIGLIILTASLTSTTTTMAITGIAIYYVGFSVGVGPVCWLYASEIYPTNIRPLLMSVCTVFNRLTGTLIASTVTTASDATGAARYYGGLAIITAISAV